MTMPKRYRWLAAALTAAVLALASQLAQAHGAHHHDGLEAAPQEVEGQAAVQAASVHSRAIEAAWSQSCPDGSGGDCCCNHQPIAAVVAKGALVNSGGWTRPVSLSPVWPAYPPAATLPQQPAISRALPRAPPYFS